MKSAVCQKPVMTRRRFQTAERRGRDARTLARRSFQTDSRQVWAEGSRPHARHPPRIASAQRSALMVESQPAGHRTKQPTTPVAWYMPHALGPGWLPRFPYRAWGEV